MLQIWGHTLAAGKLLPPLLEASDRSHFSPKHSNVLKTKLIIDYSAEHKLEAAG